MKYIIRELLKSNDIIPNIASTYPIDALNVNSEKEFVECIKNHNCNFLCYHITRLTEYEINDIRNNGLSWGSKTLCLNKIANLPSCCDWFKDELIKHITNLRDTQADDMICLSYGYLDLDEDPAYDNIFHTNWGGETIYNYYDKGDGFQNEHSRKIHNTLQKISFPCLIIVRVTAHSFFSLPKLLFEKIQNENKEQISGSIEISNELPEIVDIIDLNKYDGIDF